MTNLEKYLYQLRRIEEHREAKAEKEIRKIYKELLKELNSYLGNIYATYSEDDMLTYGSLAKAGMDARFLEEVEQRINGISPQVASQINETVTQTYEACYDGMRNAVVKAAGNREQLKAAFSTVSAVTPEVIKAAVNNPVSGLTLKDTLEKHRRDIIYDIKRNIGVGLSNGDRFSTMARRIAESLDGDYTKSVRIVRTEAHRVRETGFNDAATAINDTLKQGKSGYVMAKTWRTMQDERVRPAKAKGKAKKYNHVKMDGVTIPQDELFVLPSGCVGMCPSQITGDGNASENINCRCYLSYDLVLASTLKKADGTPYYETVIDNDYVVQSLPPHINDFGNYDEYVKAINEYAAKNPNYQRYFTNTEWKNFDKYTETERENVKRFDITVAKLNDKYPLYGRGQLVVGEYDSVKYRLTAAQRARATVSIGDAQAQAWSVPDSNLSIIAFNPTGVTGNLNKDLVKRLEKLQKNAVLSSVLDNSAEGYAIHEYGHLMSEYVTKAYIQGDDNAQSYWEWYKSLNDDDKKKGVSTYAATNRNEFEAECFAELLTGNPRPIAKKYGKYLEAITNGVIKFSN